MLMQLTAYYTVKNLQQIVWFFWFCSNVQTVGLLDNLLKLLKANKHVCKRKSNKKFHALTLKTSKSNQKI